MKKTIQGKINCLFAAFLAVILALGVLVSLPSDTGAAESSDRATIAELTATGGSKVSLLDMQEVYIVFSSDAIQYDQTLASTLRTTLAGLKPTLAIRSQADSMSPTKWNVLVGKTKYQESQDFYNEVLAAAAKTEDLVWGYACVNGKILYLANLEESFKLGADEFLKYLADSNYAMEEGTKVIKTMTREDYNAMLEADAEAQRLLRIEEVKKLNAAFKQSDFGGAPLEMPKGVYDLPLLYPAANQHPRMFLANADLDYIYDVFLNDPNMEAARLKILEYANSKDFDGVFPEKLGSKTGEYYRYNTTIIAQLEARAFMYLLTGDERCGYEAIYGAKNAMLSLHYTTDLHMDVYHGASHVMVTVAKVYDWCYDLLTEDDKNQIIAGVSNVLAPQMESGMRFPPSGMTAIVGHGNGPQFIRDWMTVAIVFFDEMPSWWDYVGGRFYQEYVPTINAVSEGGLGTDGTTTYGDSKLLTRSWAAWLVQTTTGEFPYAEYYKEAVYYFFSHIQPNGKYFQTGDGARTSTGATIGDSCAYMMLAAMMYQDETIAAMAKYYTEDYTRFSYAFTLELTAPYMVIYYALGPKTTEVHAEGMDKIQYFPPHAATITARDTWDEDGAAIMMRIGTLALTGHNLYDHGTFQIYYKGLLAGTSGIYKDFGNYVHKYYLQATIAHNGLLIFDPAYADDEPVYGTNPDGSVDVFTIKNAERYYYSGSQKRLSTIKEIADCYSEEYTMADMLGVDYAYNADGSSKYAYIAADLTGGYDKSTVEFVGRKMLTVFTGRDDIPLYFFIYDQIDSTKSEQTKSFLLHTVKEPIINGKTAIIEEGEGRLVLNQLLGDGVMSKIGGRVDIALGEGEEEHFWKTSKAFWINGKNCYDSATTDSSYDIMWGRIEINHTGDTKTEFFNAMYVTDAGNDLDVEFKTFENDDVVYTQVENIVAAFTTTKDMLRYSEFSFSTVGTGLYEYFVSGLEVGTWTVSVDGVRVATVQSESGEGFASFIAPSGEVTVTPGPDVVGANGGKIKYVLNGGTIEEDYAPVYKNDSITPLPTKITKPNSIFVGWYTSPTFEESTRIYEILEGTTGTLTIYARWLNNLTYIDYNTYDPIEYVTGQKSHQGVSYNANDANATELTGASFITKADDDGTKYLEWCKGNGSGPIISKSSLDNAYGSMTTDDESASFEITISRDGKSPLFSSEFRTYTKLIPGATEESDSTISRQVIFYINTDGEVRLGDKNGPIVTMVGEDKTTIRIVFDFKNEELRAYDDYGNVCATYKLSPKTVTYTVDNGTPNDKTDDYKETVTIGIREWRKLINRYLFRWHADSGSADSSMKIYKIKIDEGNRFGDMRPQNGMIVYSLNGGGTLPSTAPIWYNKDAETKLPLPTAASGYDFRGWYTTPDFKEGTEISKLPADTKGIAYVYAKWTKTLFSEDYSSTTVLALTGSTVKNSITYNTNSGEGASFVTAKDPDGTPYLEWREGSSKNDPLVHSGVIKPSEISGHVLSYEFTFARNGDAPLSDFYIRTYSKHDTSGNQLDSSNSLCLFKVTDGKIYLSRVIARTVGEDDIEIGEITNEKTTVKITVDFENLKVYAYTDDEVYSRDIAIPENSLATTGIEYQSTFRSTLFYFMTTTPTTVADASIKFYGVKVTEGNPFVGGDVLDGNIVYFTSGAVLPGDAPVEYSKTEDTALPTLVKENYTFLGWYTSPDFSPESKLEGGVIPAGTKGVVNVYANWLGEIYTQDFTDAEFVIETDKSGSYDGMSFNTGKETEHKPGCMYEAIKDASGNTYVKASVEKITSMLYVNGNSYLNLPEFSNTAISYELSVKKEAGEELANVIFRLTTSGTAYGGFNIFKIDGASGNVAFINSEKTFATITEEFTTIRITLDFQRSAVFAYDENGNVLDSMSISVPKVAAGNAQPTTMLEWQKVAGNYLLFIQVAGREDAEKATVGFDNFKIIDGRPFGTASAPVKEYGATVVVFPNGGQTPDGNTKYEPAKNESFTLPIPERDGYRFLGWYTTADFADGTRITEIPKNSSGIIMLYANWELWGIHYELGGGEFAEGDTPYTDYVENGATPLYTPVKDGFEFGGWYTSPSFSQESLVTEIPAGTTGYTVLYAKWNKDGINYELGGGAFKEGDEPYTDFIVGEETPLITPVRDGYVFGGWYTTADFADGTKIDAVPAGATGSFWVYAEWLYTIYEDFSTVSEGVKLQNSTSARPTINDITLASNNAADAVFTVKSDENGVRYLEMLKGTKDPRITRYQNDLSTFEKTTLRVEIVVSKDKDENGNFLPFAGFTFKTLAKHDISGNSLSSNNQLYMFTVNENGAFLVSNATASKGDFPKTNKFADFDEDGKLTIIVEVDFKNLTVTGFSKDGTAVVQSTFTVPESSGANGDGVLFMKSFTYCYFYISLTSGTDDSSIRFYSIKVGESRGSASQI